MKHEREGISYDDNGRKVIRESTRERCFVRCFLPEAGRWVTFEEDASGNVFRLEMHLTEPDAIMRHGERVIERIKIERIG